MPRLGRLVPATILAISVLLSSIDGVAHKGCLYPGHGPHSKSNISTSGDHVNESNMAAKTGSHVTYSCDRGFELLQSSTRRCGKNGRWSGKEAVCAINVASHREVVRISQYVDHGDPEKSQKILDGYYSTCSSATHADSVRAQWTIDLQQHVRDIMHIQVVFGDDRKDILFELSYGDDPDLMIPITQAKEPSTHSIVVEFEMGGGEKMAYDVSLASPVSARYITIHVLPDGLHNRVSLCEVSVYSTNAATPDQCQSEQSVVHESTCFSFHRDKKLSWDRARQYCLQKPDGQSKLLYNYSSTSQEDFIKSTLRNLFQPSESFWVAGSNKEDSDTLLPWRNSDRQNGQTQCVSISGPDDWKYVPKDCQFSLAFICQFALRSCGSPNQNEGTWMTVTSNLIGGIAEYSCPDGHALIGHSVRHCLEDGYWSEEPPTCQFVDCGEPEETVNATLTLLHGSTTYGNAVEYNCENPGDNFVSGSKTRVCQRDGKWSGELPVCGEDFVHLEAQQYAAILSLEVVGIALACLVLMVLLTAITFIVICITHKVQKRKARRQLARFDSDELMFEPNKTKNGDVILAYSNGNGKSKTKMSNV